MTNHEKFTEALKFGQEHRVTTDEWLVALLSSIAESLAVIADEMKKDSDIRQKLERKLYEE